MGGALTLQQLTIQGVINSSAGAHFLRITNFSQLTIAEARVSGIRGPGSGILQLSGGHMPEGTGTVKGPSVVLQNFICNDVDLPYAPREAGGAVVDLPRQPETGVCVDVKGVSAITVQDSAFSRVQGPGAALTVRVGELSLAL